MKPLRLLLLIGLALFSITRLMISCEKIQVRKETTKKQGRFNSIRNGIDSERILIFRFKKNDPDSLQWMRIHNERFDHLVDSGITYYRNVYTKDEKLYKNYLGVLYEYKQLVYAYQDWIKYNTEKAKLEKNTEKVAMQYQYFKQRERSIFNELQHKQLWANLEP